LSIFFGGFGVLALLILWIALPTRTPHTPRPESRRSATRGEIIAAELERIRSDLQVA
jgi:hypothetical protein